MSKSEYYMGLTNVKCDILNIFCNKDKALKVGVSMFENGLSTHLPTADIDEGFILICHGGWADIDHSGVKYRLRARDIVVVFPKDIYALTNHSAEFSASWVSFDSRAVEEAMHTFSAAAFRGIAARPVYNLSENDEYSVCMGYIKLLAAKIADSENIARYEIVIALLRTLFLEILKSVVHALQVDTSEPKQRGRMLDEFVSMVRANPDKREVAYFAERLGVSPKHLSAIVADGTGMNAKDFIDRSAVEAIQQLLRATKLSVKQIAERLDFSGSGNLCRFFKANTGTTISDFKRESNT